jgi:Outer membrane protein beta-barrel domain
MKKLFIATVIALASFPAIAQSPSGLFFGGRAGFVKADGSDNDVGLNVAGVLGKPVQGNLSWEADVSLTIADAEFSGNDYEINSIAGYAVYRSEGNTHLKAKLGVAYWDDDIENDTSLSAGVGMGFRMGRGILDVEYTQINDRTDYITVGYIIPF